MNVAAVARFHSVKAAAGVFAIDLRSLAAFRIMLACALLARVLGTWPNAAAFLSDEGVLPRTLAMEIASNGQTSFYFANGSPLFASLLLAIEALAALAMLIGFRPRTAAAVCWVLHLSLGVRNPFIGSGGDALAPLLLFWGMMLPIGARWGVEAAIRETPPAPATILNIATTGLLLQASYVYFFGALMKRSPEWTTYGSAVYAAMHNDAIATHLAHFVRPYEAITQPLTFGVLWFELATPFLLFLPIANARVRLVVVPLLIMMHLGFRLFLDIGGFWLVSIASLLAFTPSLFWDGLVARREPRQSYVEIHYDAGCGLCRKISLLLRAIFLSPEALAVPAQGEIGRLLDRENSWVVVDQAGGQHTKWDALVVVVAERSKTLARLLAFLGAQERGARIYDLIARYRPRLGELARAWAPPKPYRLSAMSQGALAVVVAFCFIWNVAMLPGVERPEALNRIGNVARGAGLTQIWGMFAPHPHLDYVIVFSEGRLSDGRAVDLYHRRMQAPIYEWPRYPIEVLSSSYWTGYFDAVGLRLPQTHGAYVDAYSAYVCRGWNRSRPSARLTEVKLTFLVGQTLSNYQTDRSRRIVHQRRCANS